jgi:hypothetical protein
MKRMHQFAGKWLKSYLTLNVVVYDNKRTNEKNHYSAKDCG